LQRRVRSEKSGKEEDRARKKSGGKLQVFGAENLGGRPRKPTKKKGAKKGGKNKKTTSNRTVPITCGKETGGGAPEMEEN